MVDVGADRLLQIVFGGPLNVEEGDMVPVAPPGSRLRPGVKKMRRRNYRGVSSHGMLCSLAELGWDPPDGPDEVGILKDVAPGEPIDKLAEGGWRDHVVRRVSVPAGSVPQPPKMGPFNPAPGGSGGLGEAQALWGRSSSAAVATGCAVGQG
jgi:hypothetical protein